MRSAVKITMTALFTAGLLGMGAGAAAAGDHHGHGGFVAYESCTKEQNSFGLLNLNLDLLNQCISNHNHNH